MNAPVTCRWDGSEVLDPSQPCPKCNMMPTKEHINTRVSSNLRKAVVEQAKDRRSVERTTPWSDTPQGTPTIGIDPGAKYTGIVVRDGDVVLHSSTVVNVDDLAPLEYARAVVAFVIKEVVLTNPDYPIGIEGISDPKGYNRGKRAPINPKYVMRMAAVAGALAAAFPNAYTIPPKGNGSQHISQYPEVLKGRRPKDLPGSSTGAGTRSHEQSAFDVAGKTAEQHYLNDNPKKEERK